MAQAPTDIQDGADIDLEKQVDLLLTEIEQTADRMETRDADGPTKPPKSPTAATRPAESAAPPAARARAPKETNAAEAPKREAALGASSATDPPAPSVPEASETPVVAQSPSATPVAAAEPASPGAGLDAEVDQLLAEATASPLVVTPDKIGAVNQAAQSVVDPAERVASEAPPAAALTIGQVDEQLSVGAEAAIEDAVAGDFLAPSEMSAPVAPGAGHPGVAKAPEPVVAATTTPTPSAAAPAPPAPVVTIAAPAVAAPAPSVAAPVKAPSQPTPRTLPEDGVAKPHPLARALFSGGVALNLPLLRLEPKWRDTAGWVALNTLFIAVCLWMYLFLRPAPGAPGAQAPEPAAQHESEGHSSPAAKSKPEAHGESKPKPKEEHKPPEHAAKGKEGAKAKEHAGAEKKASTAKHK